MRARRTVAADAAARYRELTGEFSRSWATNSDSRAAVAAHSAALRRPD